MAESMIKAESLYLTLPSIPKSRIRTSLAVAVENVATATEVLLSMWPQVKNENMGVKVSCLTGGGI